MRITINELEKDSLLFILNEFVISHRDSNDIYINDIKTAEKVLGRINKCK